MSQEFQREARYAVFKFSKLNEPQSKILQEAMCKLPRVAECLVIEGDWPEYEPVWQMIEARMTAAPVPPAGVICDELAPITEQAWRSLDSPPAGAVEVSNDACRQRFTTWIDQKMGGAMLGEVVVAEYHDAHVTCLTAENARLKARADSHWKGLIDMRDERDALKAEVERLNRRSQNAELALKYQTENYEISQSDLTKARELLNQWLNMFEGGLKSGDLDSLWNETADYVDPTINQSAPAAKGGE